MISLKEIDAETYPAFFNQIVEFYAEKSINAGRWTSAEAYQKSTEETRKLLPNNESTKDNFLYWIMNEEYKVGYLWAGIGQNKEEAFIFGIEINSDQRNKGYGKEAMKQIEIILKDKSFSSIRLHVFEQSESAIHIYKNNGYKTISRIMRKKIY